MMDRKTYMELRKQLENVGLTREYTAMAGEQSGTLYRHEASGFEFTWRPRHTREDIEHIIGLFQ